MLGRVGGGDVSLTSLYIERCHRHNDALIAGNDYEMLRAQHEADGILAALESCGYSIGLIIMNADMAVMERFPNEPMCGGMLLRKPGE